MNMKLALSYASFYGFTFEDFIDKAYQLGFRAVEFIPDQHPNLYSQLSEHRVTSLKATMEALGVSCTMHNVFYDINLLSLVPAVRDNSFSITESIIDLAVQVKATALTVHPGYMFPGWRRDPVQRERFWNEAKTSCERLARLSDTIPILIENGSYHVCTKSGIGIRPLHVGIEPSEIDRLIDYSNGRVGICLDIGKAIHSDIDVVEFIRGREHVIKQVQISSVQEHLNVITRVIDLLNTANFTGFFILEGQMPEVLSGIKELANLGLSL